MNHVQTNLAGIGLLLVAAAFVIWPRLHHAEVPQPKIASCGESGGRSPFANRYQAASYRTSADLSEDSFKSVPASPSMLEQITSSSRRKFSALNRLPCQPSRSAGILSSTIAPKTGGTPGDLVSASSPHSAPPLALSESGAERQLDLPPVVFPAALIETDLPAVSSPQAEKRLGEIAGDFAEALDQSNLDPASPAYRQLWNREQANADARFRAMYGGHAWMAQHVRSHHASINTTPGQ